ncbi:hypothetical protein [Aquisalibacillus elongatus]|uniref:Uncharacterized protein n=1 Tax=Aquisalibacillus elongatus TaxID=485577 RepID=A0A3N5B017_9BACI|nr:hypothetical protein [Aquisalibacillus elongatus]RPF50674.1 hypothetical protein EDC24_2643 [Aquisalibacillus elongatus]
MKYYESVFVILAVIGGMTTLSDSPVIVLPMVVFIGKKDAALLLAEARQRMAFA